MSNGTTATFSMIAQLQNETPAHFRQLTENMRNTANAPGMRDLPSRFNDLTVLAGSTAQNIQQILLPALSQLGIRSLTAAGIVTGTFVGAHKISQEAIGLRNLSALTGDSLEDLDKMHKGWKAAGGELEEINDALMKGAQIKSQWQAGPLKNSIGLAAQVTDILVAAGHAPLVAQLGKLIADDKRGGSGVLLSIVKLVKEAESDPIIQAMIFGKMGLSPLFAATDIEAQYKAATAGTHAALEATEEYEKVWNEMATEMINLRNTIFNAIGPGLTGSLRLMNLAFTDPARLWRLMVLSIQAITPDWIKRLFGWQGSAAQGPPDPTVPPGGGGGGWGGAPGLRPRARFESGGASYRGGGSPSGLGGTGSGSGLTPSETGSTAAGDIRLGEKGAHGYQRGGVQTDPWLVETVRAASQVLPEGYRAEVISTVDARGSGTPWHPGGKAIDIQIYDPQGRKVPYIGDPNVPGYDIYRNMAAAAHNYQKKYYPQQTFTWGGFFQSGVPYDRMHFQSGGVSRLKFTQEQLDKAGLPKRIGDKPISGGTSAVNTGDAFSQRFAGAGGEAWGHAGGGAGYLAAQRERLGRELKEKPWLVDWISAIAKSESPTARGRQAVIESMFNRAIRDNMTLERTTSKAQGFYGPVNRGEITPGMPVTQGAKEWGTQGISGALGGSNITGGATDQGMVGEIVGSKWTIPGGDPKEYFGDLGGRDKGRFRERQQEAVRRHNAAEAAARQKEIQESREKLLTYGQGALDRALRTESSAPETVEGSASIKVVTAGPRGVRQSRDVFKRPVLSRSQQMGFAKTESIAPDPAHAGEDQ